MNDNLSFSVFREIINSSSIDQVKIEKNDLIILASDGLWDVLKGEELHQIIERNQNQVNSKPPFFISY